MSSPTQMLADAIVDATISAGPVHTASATAVPAVATTLAAQHDSSAAAPAVVIRADCSGTLDTADHVLRAPCWIANNKVGRDVYYRRSKQPSYDALSLHQADNHKRGLATTRTLWDAAAVLGRGRCTDLTVLTVLYAVTLCSRFGPWSLVE